MRVGMNKKLKWLLYVCGGLAALTVAGVVAFVLFFIFGPEKKPYRTEARGVFDIYWYHYDGLGEPGHEEVELWHRGKRLTARPKYTSVSPAGDRILYVDIDSRQLQMRNPPSNGLYYFDARIEKKYKLLAAGEPWFLNGQAEFPLSGTEVNASPWSPDGTFAVVDYELQDPEHWRSRRKQVLFVNLATGETRDAAEVLGSEAEGLVFRGWSDHGTMLFSQGDEVREVPVSAIIK